ncbi:phosphatidate cytidylyltransferase, mitochondrial isoform X8 [Macaca fascicularis]
MNEDVTLRSALDRNLKSAVTTAFLMLPESFSEEDLFIEIAGLSYSGDFRMVVGEDKTKVLNIVKPNIAHFRELYGSILQENPQVVYKSQQGRLEIDKSPEGQFTQLMTLPKSLQQQIHHIMDSPGKNRDVEETLFQVAHDPDCGDVVRLGLSAIVRPSSIRQSTKGIFTAASQEEGTQGDSPGHAWMPILQQRWRKSLCGPREARRGTCFWLSSSWSAGQTTRLPCGFYEIEPILLYVNYMESSFLMSQTK